MQINHDFLVNKRLMKLVFFSNPLNYQNAEKLFAKPYIARYTIDKLPKKEEANIIKTFIDGIEQSMAASVFDENKTKETLVILDALAKRIMNNIRP